MMSLGAALASLPLADFHVLPQTFAGDLKGVIFQGMLSSSGR